MITIYQRRLAALETQVGRTFPPELRAALFEQEPILEGQVAFVTAKRIWDVRTSYTLDDGKAGHQLDHLYGLVGDILPKDAVPVAADWGDNFYCLMLAGPNKGTIVYWDHERDLDDDRVEIIAGSLHEFFAALVPSPDQDA